MSWKLDSQREKPCRKVFPYSPLLPSRVEYWNKKEYLIPALRYDVLANFENPELYAVFPYRHGGVAMIALQHMLLQWDGDRIMLLPPCLVIREAVSCWVESRPVQEWSATLQAFGEGCFRNTWCFDATGGLWSIVSAELAESPSLVQGWLPWRRIRVKVEFGPRAQSAVEDIVAKLAELLDAGSEFAESMGSSREELLQRLRGARSPLELIRTAKEYL